MSDIYNEPLNLVASCRSRNSRKYNKTPEEAELKMGFQPIHFEWQKQKKRKSACKNM